jgi:hypothetical protein
MRRFNHRMAPDARKNLGFRSDPPSSHVFLRVFRVFDPASSIHAWVKLVLDQADKAFDRAVGRPPRIEQMKDRKIEQLEAKLTQKNEVIAELMQEHVKLKKETGER